MKDVLALKKLSPALQLSLQLSRVVLVVALGPDVRDETFRDLLVDRPEEILAHASAIEITSVSDAAYEQICRIMEDAEYNPGLAARESEAGFWLDLDTEVAKLRRALEADHDQMRRLLPTTTFCVAIDGSRQSYMAFEITTRLRRQGMIILVTVDEEPGANSIQMPVISSEFVVEEYKAHIGRLRLPRHRVTIETINDVSISTSIATHLLDFSATHHADFLVLGAVGKGGPAIEQLGHVPRDVLRFATQPVIIVPPAPVNALPARSYTFVVALDHSSVGYKCLNAALKLMRPSDSLCLVHFYKKPIAGSYDEVPFASYNEFLETAKVQGRLDILAMEPRTTTAESLHDYVRKVNAAYLIMGLHGTTNGAQYDKQSSPGELENVIGRVASSILFSPHCALCLCP
ncbi:hypothetical protein Poli38472_007701 [Pythium oligandrum]|uniref:UspA domain-containing protein n=1 Tax=Pythium oligandrum TaxID=41045 RepID=A0A8K1CRQ0_PYTOL|nr:hypothetical protein Poli38472_007701 [Pythium oligandrum]|eukprot:TMW68029.1 hypothetical protein Poli38472_007701 [Pythium oligandrum]